MKQKKKKKGFTLVELIVVITILAILGTIAFISFQSYSINARNGARIADLNNIKKNLELFIIEKGYYPSPDGGNNITYQGGLAWTQGTIGDNVITNIININKKPVDPLTGNEYTYSITNLKTEYQLGSIYEGGVMLTDNLTSKYYTFIPQANAANEKKAVSMITGNYNGVILKISTGSVDYILAVPSIINANLQDLNLLSIINNKTLAFDKHGNLPSSYKDMGYIMTGGFDFVPSRDIVVYSGTLDTLDEDSNKLIFIDNLQNVYKGTLLQGDSDYKDFVNLDVATNQTLAIEIVKNYINKNVGGLVVNSESSSNSTSLYSCTGSLSVLNATVTNTSGLTGSTNYQTSNPTELCYFACNSGYNLSGNSCVIAPCSPGYGWNGSSCIAATICDTGISELTLANGQTWSCMNAGATTTWNGTTLPANCGGSATNCNSSLTWMGNHYQWGRNDTGWTDGQSAAPYYYGWESYVNNKWGGVGTTPSAGTWGTQSSESKLLMQGPCPIGRHVPTIYEWRMACNTITGTNCLNNSTTVTAMKSTLKLPPMGYRGWSSGGYNSGIAGPSYYGSSSPAYGYGGPGSPDAYLVNITNTNLIIADMNFRSQGYAIRCLRD